MTDSRWVKMVHIARLVHVDQRTVLNWTKLAENPLPCKRVSDRVIRINIDDFWNWWHRGYRTSRKRQPYKFTPLVPYIPKDQREETGG